MYIQIISLTNTSALHQLPLISFSYVLSHSNSAPMYTDNRKSSDWVGSEAVFPHATFQRFFTTICLYLHFWFFCLCFPQYGILGLQSLNLCFVFPSAFGNTGRYVAQGTGPQPSYLGPFGRLLRPVEIIRWTYSFTSPLHHAHRGTFFSFLIWSVERFPFSVSPVWENPRRGHSG